MRLNETGYPTVVSIPFVSELLVSKKGWTGEHVDQKQEREDRSGTFVRVVTDEFLFCTPCFSSVRLTSGSTSSVCLVLIIFRRLGRRPECNHSGRFETNVVDLVGRLGI